MKITLKRTDEQVELVKAMASRNRDVAYEAQQALAEFIGPVIAEVINQAPTMSNLFNTIQYNDMDSPSIPLDLYYDITAPDYVKVYSTSVAGGLPTNTVAPTASEFKFNTYRLDSAVDFDKRYAAKSRLDVVGKTFTRVAQEVLLRQEDTSANLILGSLEDATTNGQSHIKTSAGEVLTLADFNELLTLAKRINAAWSGGTPERGIKGITDMIMSPERVEDLRAMAYNPVNTTASGLGTEAAPPASPLAATDELRNAVYNSAGLPSFYGINIMEINELGKIGAAQQKYLKIYNSFTGTGEGDQDVDDLVIGLDRSRDSLFRAVALDSETGAEFSLVADDQYSVRQQKIGYYGSLEEGRMVLDNRVLTGITFTAAAE
jgi:hypothetical protein